MKNIIILFFAMLIPVFSYSNYLSDLVDLSGIADIAFAIPNSTSGMIFQRKDFISFRVFDDSMSFFITMKVDFPTILNTSHLSYLCSSKKISPSLMKAIIKVESSFKIHAISISNAKGLMQLKTITAFENGAFNSFDPFQNVSAGCNYLSKLIEKTKSIRAGLASYFMGYHGFKEKGFTQKANYYVEKVLKYKDYYERKDIDEIIWDTMRIGFGFVLKPNEYELHFLSSIPILGYLQFGSDMILKNGDFSLILNPSIYMTDLVSFGMKFNPFDFHPIIGVSLRSIDSKYTLNLSGGVEGGINFSIIFNRGKFILGYRAGKNGIAFGGNMNIEDVNIGGGVNMKSFDSFKVFLSINFFM